MARQYTREEKAQAVARVMAGESRRRVASDVGVGASTVKRWVASANKPLTDVDELLADEAGDIAERIKQRQTQVRELLLDRLFALAPNTRSPDVTLDAIDEALGAMRERPADSLVTLRELLVQHP